MAQYCDDAFSVFVPSAISLPCSFIKTEKGIALGYLWTTISSKARSVS